MIKAAGGIVEKQDVGDVLKSGGRVITASPAVFERIKEFTEIAMNS